MNELFLYNNPFDVLGPMMGVILVLMVWEAIWKGIALWKSGRNNQLAWFIAILVLNTAGILPIIYIAFFQKKKARVVPVEVKKRRR